MNTGITGKPGITRNTGIRVTKKFIRRTKKDDLRNATKQPMYGRKTEKKEMCPRSSLTTTRILTHVLPFVSTTRIQSLRLYLLPVPVSTIHLSFFVGENPLAYSTGAPSLLGYWAPSDGRGTSPDSLSSKGSGARIRLEVLPKPNANVCRALHLHPQLLSAYLLSESIKYVLPPKPTGRGESTST